MNLIKDDRIFEKYFKPIADKFKRNTETINEVVIHGTGGGQYALDVIDWMLSGEREKEYKKGIALFHYEIDRNGDIYEILSPDYWCYHSSSGVHDRFTLGVEFVNTKPDNKGIYTYEQYSAFYELLISFIKHYPIKYIVGHGHNKQEYSKEYKECPGQFFEWNKLQKKFDLKLLAKECYRI